MEATENGSAKCARFNRDVEGTSSKPLESLDLLPPFNFLLENVSVSILCFV